MENLIFQYTITSDFLDEQRKDVGGRKRSSIYKEISEISSQSFQIYADILGCDYLFSNEQIVTAGHTNNLSYYFEVLRIIYDTNFDAYDKVLFLDTDIVCNTTESIFDVCDAEVFGVYESDIKTENGGSYASWDKDSEKFRLLSKKFQRFDCPVIPALPPHIPSKCIMMNTGVMVWTRAARLKARECFDDWVAWMEDDIENPMWLANDQPFINAQFSKYNFDIDGVDQTWNDTPTHYREPEVTGMKSNFLHYTGGQNKLEMVKHYHKGLYKIFDL